VDVGRHPTMKQRKKWLEYFKKMKPLPTYQDLLKKKGKKNKKLFGNVSFSLRKLLGGGIKWKAK